MCSKWKVLVTRFLPEQALSALKGPEFEIDMYDSTAPMPRDLLLERVRGKHGIFCLLSDNINAEVFNVAGAQLKTVGTMSVGYDHIDVQECKARGIRVGYTPDVLNDAVSELAITLLLTVSRRISEGINSVRLGSWSSWRPFWMCGHGLTSRTVGIVGLGGVGQGIVKRLKPFGISKFLYTGTQPRPHLEKELGTQFASLDELLQESDIVIASCALNAATTGLFNATSFNKMKETSIFINISRGAVVNQDDLYDALKSGKIWAAGLDVTSPEPLPTDHPLQTLDNCTIFPHIGSATTETRLRMVTLTCENIAAGLQDKAMEKELKI